MKSLRSYLLSGAMVLACQGAWAQHTVEIGTKAGAPVQSTMYGIFFEDINFGADGGLYAELVENRSFEFPNSLMGWETFGNVEVSTFHPAFDRCPHYVTLRSAGHREKRTGLGNSGFFGMGLKEGLGYEFSVYARQSELHGQASRIRVELLGENNEVIASEKIAVETNRWNRLSAVLHPSKTVAKGKMRIFLDSKEPVDIDHVSLFPEDNWNGLRADLVKDLKDLNPGIFRFPGGCIVEGADLETRYQWKNSVGRAENRPLNENRWNTCFAHRLYPNYFQSYGLGFYEYFLLAEYLGAEPLPVLSVGLACQYQNDDHDKNAHVALDDLQPYIDDALDLVEFANGAVTTKWGALRAEMGHPAPFNLKQIAIGNEQWGPMYPERLEKFMEQMRKKYPEIKICGSSGPSSDGKDFDYGWQEMRRLGVDLVDEHYYKEPDWFLKNAGRYDDYPRTGPKVFAGEYAAHTKNHDEVLPTDMNTFEAALSEAAFMTGLERNADVVLQATYAPLFAHVDGWQWRPDLIWFDNLKSVRTPNWYVQMLYGTNAGTNVVSALENGKPLEGEDGLYVSAVLDKNAGTTIVKVVNVNDSARDINLKMKGLKESTKVKITCLHSDNARGTNSPQLGYSVQPTEQTIALGTNATVTIPAKTFAVMEIGI